MQCIGKSPLVALLTDPIKRTIQEVKTNYETQCNALGSPVTLDLGGAFALESSTANSASASASTSASASASTTLSSTSSSSSSVPTTGAGHVNAPSLGIAAAAAVVIFAAI